MNSRAPTQFQTVISSLNPVLNDYFKVFGIKNRVRSYRVNSINTHIKIPLTLQKRITLNNIKIALRVILKMFLFRTLLKRK